jgi:hypothetical protein
MQTRGLAARFRQACAEPEAALPAHGYDFFDLARYERDQLAGERTMLDRFWANALADADLTPNLTPPCVPCAPGEEERGFVRRHALPRELARTVRARAAELCTTLPFLLRSLLGAAAHLYC